MNYAHLNDHLNMFSNEINNVLWVSILLHNVSHFAYELQLAYMSPIQVHVHIFWMYTLHIQ